jgi:hypothetical protein
VAQNMRGYGVHPGWKLGSAELAAARQDRFEAARQKLKGESARLKAATPGTRETVETSPRDYR